jgi:RecB family exonuclease
MKRTLFLNPHGIDNMTPPPHSTAADLARLQEGEFRSRVLRLVQRHLAAALAADPGQGGTGTLYDEAPGQEAARLMAELAGEAVHGGSISALDYRDLFDALTRDREARQPVFPHADVLIWGTQEARVQGADLLICAGLNEGIWPAAPPADPWLNRALRAQAGLRLPDRVIGLSAHDFQQAASAPEVWLTRAKRTAETDTVPSRWLNRLINLMEGASPETKAALDQMRARGLQGLAMAETLLTPAELVPFAPRPSPAPPLAARPRRLGVTEIETLIRDPYAIYARKVLRLRALDPLRSDPDARLRGTILHKVLEDFVIQTKDVLPPRDAALGLLMDLTDRVLADTAPFPAVSRLWRARMARVAGFFVDSEMSRRAIGTPLGPEIKDQWEVPGTGITLSGKADRIDRLADGRYAIYDYKTGTPPTPDQEKHFNKQLWIEALMIEAGCFGLGPGAQTAQMAYIGLGAQPQIVAHHPDPAALAQIMGQLHKRLMHMLDEDWGFSSRRSISDTRFDGDFDQLARHGEWDETDIPVIIPLGREAGA